MSRLLALLAIISLSLGGVGCEYGPTLHVACGSPSLSTLAVAGTV